MVTTHIPWQSSLRGVRRRSNDGRRIRRGE